MCNDGETSHDFLEALQALLRVGTDEAKGIAKQLCLDAGWILTTYSSFDNEPFWELQNFTRYPGKVLYRYVLTDRISDLKTWYPDTLDILE
jgi:hypothetical protein